MLSSVGLTLASNLTFSASRWIYNTLRNDVQAKIPFTKQPRRHWLRIEYA
jgi:hypothetical protein